MRIVPPTPDGIALAAAAIRAGELVAYPTETVYGIGADPFSEAALRRLFEAKRRDASNPVLLIIADPDQVTKVAASMSPEAMAFARAFWPGPLSLLLPRAASLSAGVTAGNPKVCVRCPSLETARALCRAVGGPITSTSANLAGRPPARQLTEIDVRGIAVGIDGGVLPESPPSTVFDPDTGVVVRHGVITAEQLRAVSRA